MAAKPTLLLLIVFAVVLEAALGSPAPTDQEGTSKSSEDNSDSETSLPIPLQLSANGSQQEEAAIGTSESRKAERSQLGVSTGTDETEQEQLGIKEDSFSEGDDDDGSEDDDGDDDRDDRETQDKESLSTKVKNVESGYMKRDGDDEEDEQEYAQGSLLPTPAFLTGERPSITADGTYIVNDEKGDVCILAYIKLQITIHYLDKQDTQRTVVVSPDDTTDISGTCDRVAQTADLVVAWDVFVFTISFRFEDLTKSWYASQFKVVADLSDSLFEGSKTDEKVMLTSPEDKRYWQTSQDRSFRCFLLHDVSLNDKEGYYWGRIHLGEARVQAFSDEPTFKSPKFCIHRGRRDEMVPITVGAVLASLSLVTIIGYAGFRYFKIKKVQYDTME